MRVSSNFTGLPVVAQLSQHHLRIVSIVSSCSLVDDGLTVSVWAYFWAFCSVAWIRMTVSLPIPCCFDYCSFVVFFEVGEGCASSLFSVLRIALREPVKGVSFLEQRTYWKHGEASEILDLRRHG